MYLSHEGLWPLYLWYEATFIMNPKDGGMPPGHVIAYFTAVAYLFMLFVALKDRDFYDRSLMITIPFVACVTLVSSLVDSAYFDLLVVFGAKDKSSWIYYTWAWFDFFCIAGILLTHIFKSVVINRATKAILLFILVNDFWYILLEYINISEQYWVRVEGYPGKYRPNALSVVYTFYSWISSAAIFYFMGGFGVLKNKLKGMWYV